MRACALSMVAVLFAGCSRDPARATQPASPPRTVVLITIDSLRADHVGAYGDADSRTPTLDALSASGVRFDRAYATAPLTVPSYASMMTGRYPPHHGARSDGSHIAASVPTVADAFHRAGFATAAFAGTPALDTSGLDTGFDTYDTAAATPADARVGAWVEAHKDRRMFLWVYLFAPHAPYGDPADPARGARPAIDRYDDQVAEADAQVGRLLAALGPRKQEALIVTTSDNGEAFGEHGEFTHGLFVYDTTLRVPLILSGPSIERGRVVSDPVSLVDIAPTLAALAGLGRFDSDGIDLGAILHGTDHAPPAANGRAFYAETYAPLIDYGWSPLRSVRRDDWKYVAAPRPELYDVKNDPGETRNLVDDQPARASELAREIEAISPSDAAGSEARPDPKDRREIGARLAEVASGELQGALLERVLREIIRDDPGNGVANLRLAQILADSGRCGEAVRRFKTAIAAHAPGDDAQRGFARCRQLIRASR